MIKKITFGNPFDTESVIKDIPSEKDFSFFPGNFTDISSFEWNYQLEENDIVYGLGEVMKGMDVVDSIQTVATDTFDRPIEDIRIIRARVSKRVRFR